MNCPVCSVALEMADRQGVEIDYCPRCRGVWLDRGELDKIVERSANWDQNGREGGPFQQHDRGEEGYRRGSRRRKSFLGDLFDFD